MPTYQEFIADQNRQRQALQGQLGNAQMNAQTTQRSMLGSRTDPTGALGNAASSAQSRLGSLTGGIASLDPMNPENQAAGNKYQAYDLARAGVDRASAVDPTDQFIRNALQSAAGPEGGPFNATTRNAMFTNAMESSGADAQAQSIMESAAQRGLTANDPTVQAALRRTQGDQAKAGQRARLAIDLQANPANYAAQQSAVNRLGDYNTGKQQQQQSAEDRLREMLWNEGFNRQAGSASVATPQFASAPQAPAVQQQQNVYRPQAAASTASAASRTAPAAQAPAATPYTPPRTGGTWTATGSAQTMTGQNPAQDPTAAYRALGYNAGFVDRNRPLGGNAPFIPNGR